MKIIFDRDILKRKFKKDREYLVLKKLYKNAYTVLNDDKYPAIISIKEGDSEILDKESLFYEGTKVEFKILEIESEILPKLIKPFQSENKYFFHDLLQGRCWAVSEFSRKLVSVGIEINDEYRQIAFQDTAKIYYVRAEMNALFLGVCNFFAECANMLFHFRFDKHNKNNISLLALANISYNRYHQTAMDATKLNILENWKLDLNEALYSALTKQSEFGSYIQNNNLQEDPDHERACLRLSIRRIVLTIESIFMEDDVKVHKIPMKELNVTWEQYCLIFETSKSFYRFYLGNYD